ncbi:M30 family zinc metallopeptidase [Staphylococcus aureus]|uniref:M30 family zinc metallopeptidase n=1 Tax=Staphylococcus aureus TaxID=1280 RepID=UPI001BFE824B|nr:neutral metalloprotease [Staphylococcus aureus]
MFIKSKVTKSLAVISLVSAFSFNSFANAHTYIINNEDSNQYSQDAFTGSRNTDTLIENTIKSTKPKDIKSMQEDKVFKAPKNKTSISQRAIRSERHYSNAHLNDVRVFTTVNMRNNTNERTPAKLKYDGKSARVWVADNYITSKQAINIGKEFDNKIDPLVRDKFGEPSDVDNDDKVNILVYDIKDDFDITGSYTGGYFHPRDLFDVPHSNMVEIFYMDTYPSMGTNKRNLNEKKIYSTLAHEYQHMVNANQKLLKEKRQQGMDTWLDEAFAMASEHMYLGKSLDYRIDYYNRSNSITNGHSLIKWGHHGDTLSNYSLSYLFSQYLRTQSDNGDKIFKEILQDRSNTIESLQHAIHKHVDPNMSVNQFMTNFRIALAKKEATGLHGFKGEESFDSIQTRSVQQIPNLLAPQGSVMFESEEHIEIPKDKDKKVKYIKID